MPFLLLGVRRLPKQIFYCRWKDGIAARAVATTFVAAAASMCPTHAFIKVDLGYPELVWALFWVGDVWLGAVWGSEILRPLRKHRRSHGLLV